ncbi:MAG: hypothetical protein BA874_01800 [Desulfuromonadales bacterium C00003068]|nr:MAG: hypothetical protein BA874_01800 [Desulfuromonadales bacterium C00003068]
MDHQLKGSRVVPHGAVNRIGVTILYDIMLKRNSSLRTIQKWEILLLKMSWTLLTELRLLKKQSKRKEIFELFGRQPKEKI